MIYHVLPGDAVAEVFQKAEIDGEEIVCRESLVTGDLDGDDLSEFWETRANHIDIAYGGDPIDYRESVAGELEKLLEVDAEDEVNLWFEFELFCSVNMWFCVDQLKDSGAAIYRVMPVKTPPDDIWTGFGNHSEKDLRDSFDARVRFSHDDVKTGVDLWNAFREGDSAALKELSGYRSPCFPFLREVCDAAAEIEQRPREIVAALKSEGFDDIETLFPEFKKRAGVYGFGDSQVESILRQT